MKKEYFVYILTRKRNSTFYTGMTNNLFRRISEHKVNFINGFTKKYNIKMLAIEKMNPNWEDLFLKLHE